MSVTVSCPSNKFGFWYLGYPSTGQALNFYVDDVLYPPYGSTFSNASSRSEWTSATVIVSPGPHKYTWEESATAGGPPGFSIDTIGCQ